MDNQVENLFTNYSEKQYRKKVLQLVGVTSLLLFVLLIVTYVHIFEEAILFLLVLVYITGFPWLIVGVLGIFHTSKLQITNEGIVLPFRGISQIFKRKKNMLRWENIDYVKLNDKTPIPTIIIRSEKEMYEVNKEEIYDIDYLKNIFVKKDIEIKDEPAKENWWKMKNEILIDEKVYNEVFRLILLRAPAYTFMALCFSFGVSALIMLFNDSICYVAWLILFIISGYILNDELFRAPRYILISNDSIQITTIRNKISIDFKNIKTLSPNYKPFLIRYDNKEYKSNRLHPDIIKVIISQYDNWKASASSR